MHHRALEWFSRWFGSTWGVIETALVVVAIIAIEELDPHFDPHFFWLLVWLTVYSAVTQPALAFGNEKAAKRMLHLERQNRKLLKQLQALIDHHGVEVSE